MVWSLAAQWAGVLCLLLWGFWLCCKLRLPTGFGPLAGIAFAMVALQLCGSVNLLWPGAQLLLVGAALTLAHRKGPELLGYLLRPGVLAFVAGVAFFQIYFALREPRFQTWDEFSHWGMFFKSVFYDHQFALWQTARSLAHPAYPQGLPALYALFCQFLPRTYAERDVFFVVLLPLLAAGGALFELASPLSRRARVWHLLCACLAAPVLFGLFAPDTPYTTIYMDAPVGALFAAGLLVTLLPRPDGLPFTTRRGLAIGLLCAATVTVKEIGAVFALCILGVFSVQCLLAALPDKRRWTVLARRALWQPVLAAAAPTAAVAVAWKVLLAVLRRGDDQFSSMGLSHFLQCLQQARSGVDPYFYEVWGAYYAKFRTSALLFGSSTLKLGLLCVAFSLVLAIALVRLFGRRTGGALAAAPLCLCVFWPCYQGVLFYVYIGGMSAFEAMRVASYERYACCFLIGWFAVLLGVLFRLPSARPAARPLAAGGAALAGALALCSVGSVATGQLTLTLPPEPWRDAQIKNAAAITAAIGVGPEDAGAIWLLSADADTAYQNMWYYQYELAPYLVAIETQSAQADVDLAYNISEHDVQYLVLFGVTDDFVARYFSWADDGLGLLSSSFAVDDAEKAVPMIYKVTASPAAPGGYTLTRCG